jgi:hypothetical protein
VLCKYRIHQTNVSHNRLAMSRANAQVRLWLIRSPLFSRLSRETQQYCCLSCGVSLAKIGKMVQAREMLAKTIRLRPLHIPSYALWGLSLTGSKAFKQVETAFKEMWLRATGRDRFPFHR